MIRTLIFGAIAGYIGKKLYDDGKLTEFKNDLVTRYNEAKVSLAEQRAETAPTTAPVISPAAPLAH